MSRVPAKWTKWTPERHFAPAKWTNWTPERFFGRAKWTKWTPDEPFSRAKWTKWTPARLRAPAEVGRSGRLARVRRAAAPDNGRTLPASEMEERQPGCPAMGARKSLSASIRITEQAPIWPMPWRERPRHGRAASRCHSVSFLFSRVKPKAARRGGRSNAVFRRRRPQAMLSHRRRSWQSADCGRGGTVDAGDLKSSAPRGVRVRLPPSAPECLLVEAGPLQ